MTKLRHQIDENIKPTQSETSDFFVNAFICPQYFENESIIFIKDATCHHKVLLLFLTQQECRFLAPKTINEKQLKRCLRQTVTPKL